MDETSAYFSRTRMLLGEERMTALERRRVLIVGVGGVGGWCAMALVRSGLGRLTIVDSDRVAPSNVNRQAMATPATIGELKVEALRRLLLDVNPKAEVSAHAVRYLPDSPSEPPFDFSQYDVVVDAIDSVDCKAALIRNALATPSVRLFSSMGAARRLDPFRLRHTPFSKVAGDGLARALRQRFKRDGAFPCRPFTCVWSEEPPLAAPENPNDAETRAFGSVMPVTAAFGLALASLVLNVE